MRWSCHGSGPSTCPSCGCGVRMVGIRVSCRVASEGGDRETCRNRFGGGRKARMPTRVRSGERAGQPKVQKVSETGARVADIALLITERSATHPFTLVGSD